MPFLCLPIPVYLSIDSEELRKMTGIKVEKTEVIPIVKLINFGSKNFLIFFQIVFNYKNVNIIRGSSDSSKSTKITENIKNPITTIIFHPQIVKIECTLALGIFAQNFSKKTLFQTGLSI